MPQPMAGAMRRGISNWRGRERATLRGLQGAILKHDVR